MQGGQYKLLIVDDIAANRDLLSRYFGARGFQIGEADSGLSALSLIKQERFNAVFLDILMPEIDGLEVLKRIRGIYTRSDLPVIMVSALSAHHDTKLALELGANDYVTKPVDLSSALAKLQRALQRQVALSSGRAIESSCNRKEKRRKPRRQSQCTAWIRTAKHVPPIECRVSDLTLLGACVALKKDQQLPGQFIFLLSEGGSVWQNCRLVWRAGMKLGIEFTGKLNENERPGLGAVIDRLL